MRAMGVPEVCATYPGPSIACTRGEEWALVHELLHALHQVDQERILRAASGAFALGF